MRQLTRAELIQRVADLKGDLDRKHSHDHELLFVRLRCDSCGYVMQVRDPFVNLSGWGTGGDHEGGPRDLCPHCWLS